MKSICIIPARYGSSRLPGKPLAIIGGKPMIQWVYQRALQAEKIDRVLVATDHPAIKKAVQAFGGEVVMTDPELPSGTDRVAAAAAQTDADVIINLQGDEPLVEPQLLSQLLEAFNNAQVQIATPVKEITTIAELTSPDVVHVVRDRRNWALYFSRAAIPYLRDITEPQQWLKQHKYFKHVGIYAYRKEILMQLKQLSQSPLEKAERLEQLRFMENGFMIYTVETSYDSVSVDTAQDLELVNKIIKNQSHQ